MSRHQQQLPPPMWLDINGAHGDFYRRIVSAERGVVRFECGHAIVTEPPTNAVWGFCHACVEAFIYGIGARYAQILKTEGPAAVAKAIEESQRALDEKEKRRVQ